MTETVFTYAAPGLKFGPGASAEIGHDLAASGAERVLLVTDAGVAATGHPARIADQMTQAGLTVTTYAEARVEPTDESLVRAIDFARDAGPFDAIVAVGGGSSIDTAKAVNLLTTNPGDLLDYINQPVGGGQAPTQPLLPLVAVPTTTGTGSESTTICVLDVLAQQVKTGISHPKLRPTSAVVDPDLTLSQPAMVTAAAGMDILCHALESYTARWYADFDAKTPEQRVPYCGANPIADLWSEKALSMLATSFRTAVRDGDDRVAREQMAMAATFAGLGFGNAGVHVPHANAYPIAGRVRDYRPEGYPDDEAIVPHGMAVSMTAPAAFRFTFEASPERHLHAARLLAPDAAARAVDQGPDLLPAVLTTLMRDIGLPNGLAEVGFGDGDVDALVAGSLQQQRLLATAPREVTAEDLAAVFRGLDGALVTQADVPDLLAELRRRGVTDVSDSTLDRVLYSSDASLYRVVPQAVARPRHADELHAILDVAATGSVPVTMRGAGTSIAGNAVGPGLVVDTVRHLGRVLDVDPEARTARVQPGTVHATLQRQAAPHGLRFGPDPSTHTRCTIGGMIGNNACGSRALGYGRTADNVVDLEIAWLGEDVPARLTALAERNLGHIRTHFGRFGRQVSGYSLEHLLPERGRSVDRFLVGSEGTLGVVTEATVSLVPDVPRQLTVLGYADMIEAADAVPGLLAAGLPLVACEGLDARIVDLVRARGGPVPEMPAGGGWLFVEVSDGATVPASGELGRREIADAAEATALWRIREAGAGLAARSLTRPAYPGWEDAAVPPEHLGAWLRDFDRLLREFGLDAVPYGHFGDGCVHARIDFEFDDATGRQRFREFLVASATALQAYGGSLSGEHGDGRARSELLPLMYDQESLALFAEVKAIADPANLLNPGVLVDPAPVDADVRAARPVARVRTALAMIHDGSFGDAVHRCTGVGSCVAPSPVGVMCPSYAATRDEKDSTRGRARVLQEALDGTLVDGLADPAVSEALDLCLSCKGCASDCPTGTDMATYKAEVLHQQYAGRRRPRSHYTLGRLPQWLDLTPGWARRLAGIGPFAAAAKAVAGVDRRRSLPAPSPRRLDRVSTGSADVPDVWIWGDTFTDHFGPGIAEATIAFLAGAGVTARVVPDRACCALTWVTTGQLDRARSILTDTVAALAPYVASGVPVVGLEPSCLATLRTDALELVADPSAQVVADGVLTLAELLERLDVPLPDLTGTTVVAQPHCHHASVLGWEADARLLERTGAEVTRVGGCCGLAGNFGMEQGHYEVSVAVAETQLLPAVRANAGAVVLADGLSCRHQLADLAGVRSLHLAELLAQQ